MHPQRNAPPTFDGGLHKKLKEIRLRLLILITSVMAIFGIIQIRLIDVMLFQSDLLEKGNFTTASTSDFRSRILDKDGNVLAITLVTGSLYANPKLISEPKQVAAQLSLLFPDLNFESLRSKLASDKGFIWIKRNLSPQDQQRVMNLGIPGLDFLHEKKRLYPHGNLFSHVLGTTDIDGNGVAGIEKQFDDQLKTSQQDVQLSLSVPIQHAIYDELQQSIQKFNAEGGSAIVVSLDDGKVVGMVSAPDFDPNQPNTMTQKTAFNRNTLGTYELGSIMKILNTAFFLHHGEGDLDTVFDASKPLRIGRFTVNDYHGQGRPLTVEEIFFHSSNIGSAQMALTLGPEKQMAFLRDVGLFDTASIELPEKGRPLLPSKPSKASCITIAFGHGVAATPIQFAQSLTNLLSTTPKPLSILRESNVQTPTIQHTFLSPKDRKSICALMQKTIEKGTTKKAQVKGYLIGGKSGTAEIIENGKYVKKGKNLNSFVGLFPIQNPKYLVFATLDQPKAIQGTFGFTAAGWNAAPLGGNIIRRIAPMLGLEPTFDK